MNVVSNVIAKGSWIDRVRLSPVQVELKRTRTKREDKPSAPDLREAVLSWTWFQDALQKSVERRGGQRTSTPQATSALHHGTEGAGDTHTGSVLSSASCPKTQLVQITMQPGSGSSMAEVECSAGLDCLPGSVL